MSICKASPSALVRFALVRIDDRLLHGQVLLNWVRALRPVCIAIVDDEMAGRPSQRALLDTVVPDGVALWVGTYAQAAPALLQCAERPPERTMVLVRDPASALALFRAGVPFGELNLGCLGALPGRTRLAAQFCLATHEVEILNCLHLSGVSICLQATPSSRARPWARLERKLRPLGSPGRWLP